ncbi:MAG TPA: alpha/beta hydrolase [Alphaproteobacteria bacterium]|nr:alpha/beta hydrolase [Alphaproteobacteria bacterium]
MTTEQVITLDDGATTTIERWGERGPVMLCAHGMTSSRLAWRRLARHYADRYRVVAYDQRGHGDSANVSGPMTLERGIRDLQNVAAVTGADVLVGHSWGGAVVLRAGLTLGARAVVAIDPMLVQVDDRWYAEFIEELDEVFALQGEARDTRVRFEYTQAHWGGDDVAGKVHAVHSMTTAPIAGLRDENRGGSWDLRSDIATYPKPALLVMAGSDGTIVPQPVLDAINAHHGPHVHIVTLEDQGHNLHRTAFERFVHAMDEFLKTLV